MTWRLYERHQWAGPLLYLIASAGVLVVIVGLALLAHAVWGFRSPSEARSITLLAAVGVLFHGGATAIRRAKR